MDLEIIVEYIFAPVTGTRKCTIKKAHIPRDVRSDKSRKITASWKKDWSQYIEYMQVSKYFF